MRFGRTLRNAIYPQWRSQYMDYAKIKSLLKEDAEEHTGWTSDDESKFCDEIFNVELEKVAAFQENTFKDLEARTNRLAAKIQELTPENGEEMNADTPASFKEIEAELDAISNETKELKKFSEINYTAFLKIVKKHDRKRGSNYKIRPMLLMSLSKRPFNSEQGYSPLLNKLSIMYYAVRQQLDEEATLEANTSEEQSQVQNGERYTAYKFWVHPENLLEVKTFILRRLPILVYSELSSKDPEAIQGDPTLNSLYFDNPDFTLYNEKVERQVNATSLRIRWFGQLNSNPELVIEKKIIHENGTSEERRFPIKEKYIQQLIKGEYRMEKSIAKMERQDQPEARIDDFKKTVLEIQKFIFDHELQPVLRANYTRTAFQKPLDDKVRISIDTNLAFIREDCIDLGRPCRNPEDWHRLDVDNTPMTYPFPNLNQGEINRFPYAILEIKVKDQGGKKYPQWVEDLMASHLVHKTPRFSKFVHGVAVLFEDNVNNLPFWLSDLERDIRKDPQAAFEEEEQRKAKRAENEQVVGSLLAAQKRGSESYKASLSSPIGRSILQEHSSIEERSGHPSDFSSDRSKKQPEDEGVSSKGGGYGTMASIFPSFSNSRYAQARRRTVELPTGVIKPELLIKDSGPLKVEPKVWLANERTFVKWMHIAIQLAVLGVGLNAAGSGTRAEDRKITMWFGVVYVVIAAFTSCWGLYMQRVRRKMILERSGKDFDNWIGPLAVGFAFLVALVLNFLFKFRALRQHSPQVVDPVAVPEGLWHAELL